jgi:hypothetical protein
VECTLSFFVLRDGLGGGQQVEAGDERAFDVSGRDER